METTTRNRLLCLNDKLDYVQQVLEDAVIQLEAEIGTLDENQEECRSELQNQLNAFGNAFRNIGLAKTAIGSAIYDL